MMINDIRGSAWTRALLAAGLLSVPGFVAVAGEVTAPGFALVAKTEPLEGILAQSRRARAALQDRAEGRRGLERLEARVLAEWPRIRQIDLVALSRFHIEQTVGFELPAEAGELTGQVMGHDEAGLWHLELRGPRLPARYDIVHRYLHVYATFDPATDDLDRLTITIRGWVLE